MRLASIIESVLHVRAAKVRAGIAEPLAHVRTGICVDCDQRTAVTREVTCSRCGSSSVVITGNRAYEAMSEIQVEREAQDRFHVSRELGRMVAINNLRKTCGLDEVGQ